MTNPFHFYFSKCAWTPTNNYENNIRGKISQKQIREKQKQNKKLQNVRRGDKVIINAFKIGKFKKKCFAKNIEERLWKWQLMTYYFFIKATLIIY